MGAPALGVHRPVGDAFPVLMGTFLDELNVRQ